MVIFLHDVFHWYLAQFIDWLCCTESINSVVMAFSKYGGSKFLGIWLCLALAQYPTQKIWVGEADGATNIS